MRLDFIVHVPKALILKPFNTENILWNTRASGNTVPEPLICRDTKP
jgi:hypothetical protein